MNKNSGLFLLSMNLSLGLNLFFIGSWDHYLGSAPQYVDGCGEGSIADKMSIPAGIGVCEELCAVSGITGIFDAASPV